MKVLQGLISRLDSTEKQESNFGNLSPHEKRWFVPKRKVFISLKIFNGGGVDPQILPPPRAHATVAIDASAMVALLGKMNVAVGVLQNMQL